MCTSSVMIFIARANSAAREMSTSLINAGVEVEEFIREGITAGCTHADMARLLQRQTIAVRDTRGLSTRSVRQYCHIMGIRRSSHLTDDEVDQVVERAVSEVGPSYGTRTLAGYIRSHGTTIGERRIRSSKIRVAPGYVRRRDEQSYRLLNPIPYYAQYHGHKLNIDQNEKLTRYGAASDGYSGQMMKVITMPVKNPIIIYGDLFRFDIVAYYIACVINCTLFDQSNNNH